MRGAYFVYTTTGCQLRWSLHKAGTTGCNSRDHRETPLRRQLVRVQNYYKKKDSVIFLNASNDTEKERYREEHGPFGDVFKSN